MDCTSLVHLVVAAVDGVPSSIFINAMDTNPLAADPVAVLKENEQDFIDGLTVLSRLHEGKLHLWGSRQ